VIQMMRVFIWEGYLCVNGKVIPILKSVAILRAVSLTFNVPQHISLPAYPIMSDLEIQLCGEFMLDNWLKSRSLDMINDLDTFSPVGYTSWPVFIHIYLMNYPYFILLIADIIIISVRYIIGHNNWHINCVTI
jgi:hypothetical protein